MKEGGGGGKSIVEITSLTRMWNSHGQAGGIIIHDYGFFLISFYFSTFWHVVSAHAAGHDDDKDEEEKDMGGGRVGYMNPANSSWTGGAEHDQPE